MSEHFSDRAEVPNLWSRVREYLPARLRRDVPVVPVVRLSGTIGAITPLRPGLTLAGVVDATVAAMERLGARRGSIHAAVGPCIAHASYEVGPEFPAPFTAQDNANAAFFTPSRRAGHHMFDLPGYLLRRLALLGVASAEASGHDTLSNQEQFFSFRYNTLNGIRDYGRGLSAIALVN